MPLSQQTIQYRKDNNLCGRCGQPNAPEKKMCEKHLAQVAARQVKKRKKRRNESKCEDCNKHSLNRLCDDCQAKRSQTQHRAYKKRYYSRKDSSLCVECGDTAIDDKTMCQKCLEKNNHFQKRRRDKLDNCNLCVVCGQQKSNDGKRCQECIEKRNEWYAQSEYKENNKEIRRGWRKQVLDHYGGKCQECGEDRWERLAIDHVHGKGNQHRKKINKYGSSFDKWLIDNDFPEGFQVLCHNCNMAKAIGV